MSSGGNVTFGSTLDSKTATAGGTDDHCRRPGDVTFTGAVGSVHPLGALSVISSRNFVESAGLQAQSVNVVSTNNITFTGNVTTTASVTGTGTITVNADSNGVGTGTFTESGGMDASSLNSAVSIKADQVSLIGTVKSGTATTTIQGSDNETIGLGSGARVIFQLTNLELGQIFSGALCDIGGTTTGTITSDTATTGSQQGPATLNAQRPPDGFDPVHRRRVELCSDYRKCDDRHHRRRSPFRDSGRRVPRQRRHDEHYDIGVSLDRRRQWRDADREWRS